MTPDTTPVTLTLPRWFLERISEDVENEARYYAVKVRTPSRFPNAEPTTQYKARMQSWKARWDEVESAINTALDESERYVVAEIIGDVSGPGKREQEATQ